MGEAKRRKKYDPNYGKNHFDLKFLSEDEVDESMREHLHYLTKKVSLFYYLQLTYQSEVIIGIGHPFISNKKLDVKCFWAIDPHRESRQKRIVERLNKPICQKVAEKAKQEMNKYNKIIIS